MTEQWEALATYMKLVREVVSELVKYKLKFESQDIPVINRGGGQDDADRGHHVELLDIGREDADSSEELR